MTRKSREPIVLPRSGGSFTRDTKGKLKLVEEPTRKQTPEERRAALGLPIDAPAQTPVEEDKT